MKRMYIVRGEYEGRVNWDLGAYTSEKKAQKHCDTVNAGIDSELRDLNVIRYLVVTVPILTKVP